MQFSKSTVYQIYIKSFQDSTGNGVGDLNGIRSRLDYLKELGVDYIWLTPFFKSPLNDNGYDVADYCTIDLKFGTKEDLKKLISEADKRGIGLMLDMVFNHTSTEHEWFKKALAGDPVYQDYYIFKEGKADAAPTNWESKFGGNAWEYAAELKKWYLHLFDVSQADLNWDNPQVRKELKNVIFYWKNMGFKGFRFDVVNLISKPEIFCDDLEGDGRRYYTDGHRVHEFLKELVHDTGIDGMITVGEMSSTTIDNCVRYSNAQEHELSMCFNFHHLKVDYKNGDKWQLMAPDLNKLKELLVEWQLGMQKGNGWNALFWCNHDQPRAVSRFCNDKIYWKQSATMLATCIYMLRGTPFVYQGEGIGMTNAGFTDISHYRDIESLNYYNIMMRNGKSKEETLEILSLRSRDNGRLPMQWDGSAQSGFTTGTPWLEARNNNHWIHVEAQNNQKDSVLEYYKKLIKLRKQYDIISEGIFEPVEQSFYNVFVYKRILNNQELYVFCNFGNDVMKTELPVDIENYTTLISNYDDEKSEKGWLILKPYQAIVLYKKDKKVIT